MTHPVWMQWKKNLFRARPMRSAAFIQVMEWGFDGVLLNTAVSRAIHPVEMAGAVRAGRSAFWPDL